MRYGIFSDIHGNLEALISVLEDLESEVEQYICVGDLVGYGANPNECVEEVMKLKNCLVVAGNHDHAAVGLTAIDTFNPYAKKAILWTKENLESKYETQIKNLELVKNTLDFYVVHATPYMPGKWFYIFTLEEAKKNFNYFEQPICFIGHSHYPMMIVLDEEKGCYSYSGNVLKTETKKKYLINVGSVGQPRDGDAKACYVIFDTLKREITLKRILYNVQKTQQKIIQAGLPTILAERLSFGQ